MANSNPGALLDPIQFIESPLGLGFTAKGGCFDLSPVQKFVLKMATGMPLDDSLQSINVPHRLEAGGRKIEVTEAGYLAYLEAEGRAFPARTPGIPRDLFLGVGRQGGINTLIALLNLYSLYVAMEEGGEKSFDLVNLYPILSQGSNARFRIEGIGMRCPYFKESKASHTNTSIYFRSPYADVSAEYRVLCKGFQSFQPRGINHSRRVRLHVVGADKDGYLTGDFLESVKNIPKIITSSQMPPSFVQAYWQAAQDPESTALSIPSWHLNEGWFKDASVCTWQHLGICMQDLAGVVPKLNGGVS